VRGTIDVTRIMPVHVSFGNSADVHFYTVRLNPELSPLRVVETPRLQRRPVGQNPWALTVRLDAEPNTYAPYVCDPVTGKPSIYNPGQFHGGQVIWSDQAMPGDWKDDKGVKSFSGANPASGVYSVLVGPFATEQSFQELSTSGQVVGRFTRTTRSRPPRSRA